MYGAETTYPVAALLLLAVLAALGAHLTVRRLLDSPWYRQLRPVTALAATVGLLLVGRALVGMLRPVVAANETPGITPLSLMVGAPLVIYALWLLRRIALRDTGPTPARSWWAGGLAVRAERAMIVAAFGVLVIGLLWTANTFAGAYGAGRAQDEAQALSRRPEVVLFTNDPLPEVPPGVTHVDLGSDTRARHEYRGLRLLLQSGDRLFLVPAEWTPDSSTLVVPYDADVRLQLRPPG
jgi:hypothetical protein